MSIRRKARPADNFYLLDKQISEDPRLSWAARGLLVFLLGKPDHWEVSTAHLVKQTGASAKQSKRDAIRALLNELINSGYVQREHVRDEGGAYQGTSYVVSEVPVPVQPETESPATVKPETDNTPLVSIEGEVSIESSARTDNPPNPPSPGGDLLSSEEQKPKPADPDVDLPANIDPNTWIDFLDHRKQIKAKMTPRAKTLMLGKLEGFAAAGHDPNEILKESIINGWKSVFEPKGGGGRNLPPRNGFAGTDYRQGLKQDENGRYRL